MSDRDNRLMNRMKELDETPLATNRKLPAITLVVGPSPFTMPRGWEFFLCSPYEGVTMIASVLFNAGYPVRIVDVRYEKDPLTSAYDQIIRGTDLLGIATFEDNFPFVRELIDKVKDARSELPIICGGSLVTSVPHLFMQETRTDIAVISEGELTIIELIDSFTKENWPNDLPKIRGIWYRDEDGQVAKTAPRGQMPTLDFIPRPHLGLWPQSREMRGLQPQIIHSYSRGCQMDCSFCFRTTPQVSFKSPEKLARDLRWLTERYLTEFIFFGDLTFNAEKPRTLDILEVIADHDIRWTCLTRCSNVDKEQLDSMYRSGCDIALYGVESLGATALKEARKPTTENISVKAMHLSWDAGVRFGALLIVGLPGETASSLIYMADWAKEHNHVTRVKYLSLIPGTSVYQQGLKDGLIRSEIDHLNWLSIEQALYEDEFLNISGLSEKVIRQSYQKMYDAYQPGPVMDFDHYPKYFAYFHPNADDATTRSTDYFGKGWRNKFSSAGPHLYPGSDRYTLDKVCSNEVATAGSSLVKCGAKFI